MAISIAGGVIGAAFGFWLKSIGFGFSTPEYWIAFGFAVSFLLIGAKAASG